MANVPFLVACTSCESILEVRNPELIGQVVACPKCGSMVLIEQTTQVRHSPSQTVHIPSVPQEADVVLSKESSNSVLPSQTSGVAITQDAAHSSPFNVTPPDEFAGEVIDKTDGELIEFFGDSVGEEQLGKVASELQTMILDNKTFDIWQKRRLIIVVVGTICLLTLFVAFLLARLQSYHVATSGNESDLVENRNALPQVPAGIEVTRTGTQPENQHPDNLPAPEGGQNGTHPLPPVEVIKVEGQSEEVGSPTDTNDIQGNNIAAPSVESAQSEPSPNPDRLGTSVRVPISSPELSSDGTFGFLDNIDTDNFSINYGGIDGNADKGEGDSLNTTPDKQPVVPDGFAGFIDEDVLSTDPNEQETTSGTVLPESFEASEEKENEDEAVDLKEIDINECLAVEVTAIHFDKAPIVDVVRALSDLSGIPIQLDVDELRARNISIEAPISLQLRETIIAEIIDTVLQKTRLTRHDGDGWLVFGYTGEQVNALRTARYDMSRLASLEQNPISAKQAADWLSQLLINQTQNNPKVLNAIVAVDGNEIVVAGTIWLQDQAKRLLQSLFYLRGLEPENGMSPERLAPEVFGWDRVNAQLSFNLIEPIPLEKAVRLIEDHAKLRILIDHAALRDEGLSQELQVTSRVSDGTIDTVLRGMLEPLGLTYRIVEANAVEITTLQVARQIMTIEPHLFAPLADGQTPESCAEILRQAFGETANWNQETGSTDDGNAGGIIVIDPVSGYMLVRQSQPQQCAIRLWFGRMHAESESESRTVTP